MGGTVPLLLLASLVKLLGLAFTLMSVAVAEPLGGPHSLGGRIQHHSKRGLHGPGYPLVTTQGSFGGRGAECGNRHERFVYLRLLGPLPNRLLLRPAVESAGPLGQLAVGVRLESCARRALPGRENVRLHAD